MDNRNDNTKILVIGGIVAVAYFGVLNPLLIKLGIKKDAQEKQQDASDKVAMTEQIRKGEKPSKPAGGINDEVIKGLARSLTTYTNSNFDYDYLPIVKTLAYFAGFNNEQANRFLSVFAQINGYTLQQWWVDKFKDAFNSPIYKPAVDALIVRSYRNHYAKYGITFPPAHTYDSIFGAAVEYLYKVAKQSRI